MAEMEATGELMLAEEVYRIAALVQLEHLGDAAAAQSLLAKAAGHSKAHGTRSFELRNSMAMAELLRRESRLEEARECLAPILGMLTEGHATADLRAAKELLSQLSKRAE